MTDRVLTWHIPDSPNPVSLPRYYMDGDYDPVAVRVCADVPPVDDLSIDIQTDGKSIFANQSSTTFTTDGQRTTIPTSTVVLVNGETSNEEIEDFGSDIIADGSWVSCVPFNLAGAKGVTVQLELDATESV